MPQNGMDLSGRSKIIFVIGRGKTGKTTLLRWMAEQALDDKRAFLMADIDPTNASFSSYFPNVSRPAGYDPVEVREWLLRFIAYAIEQRTTAIIDLGGGDTALRSLLTEMPTIFADIQGAGLAPVALYMCGPQPDDLAPIVTLSSHGFAPDARAIVFNEGVAEAGLTPGTELRRGGGPSDGAQGDSGRCADFVDAQVVRGCGRGEPADVLCCSARRQDRGRLNMFDRTRVRAWLEAMVHRFSGVPSWMP